MAKKKKRTWGFDRKSKVPRQVQLKNDFAEDLGLIIGMLKSFGAGLVKSTRSKKPARSSSSRSRKKMGPE